MHVISSTLVPTPTLFNPPNHYNIYFYEQWGKTRSDYLNLQVSVGADEEEEK